ncbi:MAG: hypothetical protein AAGK14_07245 [Verrucomicrobiota bacterium]
MLKISGAFLLTLLLAGCSTTGSGEGSNPPPPGIGALGNPPSTNPVEQGSL